MYLAEVFSNKEDQDFLQVHVNVNKQNKEWIRPLDQDIRFVFDKDKNKNFRHGEVTRWVLYNEHAEPIGRIAAFVNKKYKNKGDEFEVGGIGFFDCEENQEAANLLFDTAAIWLKARNMEAMDGPINFGERHMWWGLLVEGFHAPIYGMNYNPPYYQALFENYGFKNFYNQICWALNVAKEDTQLKEKFYQAHQHFADDGNYQVRAIQKNEGKKFAHDFCTVYNKAWSKHEGMKVMNENQALVLFKSMKPVFDDHLLWFTYYKDEPIATWLNIPDINQAIKSLNGKFDLWHKLLFLMNKMSGKINRFVGVNYGIVPEYQGSGVDYFMIVEAEKVFKTKRRYKDVELQWQGDFNPKMLNISKNLDAIQSRRMVTYRYIFDRSKPFHRHPVIV
jgi:hypothetical protein